MDSMSNRHRIARWLRGLLAEATEATLPDRIALRHLAVNDRQTDVASFGLPAESTETFDAEDLLNRIDEAIENDVDGLGGVQRYVLVALRKDRPVSRLPLRAAMSSEDVGSIEPIESEPATDKGLLAQLMRHNEVQNRMFALSIGQMFATMQRTIARQQDTIEQHEVKRLVVREEMEEALSQEQERKALTQMVEDNRAVKKAVLDNVLVYLPMLVDFIRGAAAGGSPIAEAMRKLADSLGPEQVQALSKVLTPEQMDIVEKLLFSPPAPTEETREGGDQPAAAAGPSVASAPPATPEPGTGP